VTPPAPAANDTSVTVVMTFPVRPGREAELEAFFDENRPGSVPLSRLPRPSPHPAWERRRRPRRSPISRGSRDAHPVVAVYPLGYGIHVFLGPWLVLLPMPLRALVMSVLTVFLLTWVVMPRLTRLCRRWLYPSAPSSKLARHGRPPMFAAR
jgi:antibiotic biosynthesis monooxygenase (ABM) superfamily enzyme